MTPTDIKKQLEVLGVRATKLRGQHFLIDQNALRAIVAAAELKKSDTVLEIGPGLGVLTLELLAHAGRVVAVELDLAFAKHIEEELVPQGLTLVRGDIREMDVGALLGSKNPQYKLVANIPYNITSEILEKFLLHDPTPSLMVLLVQREVAERVCAKPPKMNRLAVLVQYFGKPEIVRHVSRGAFWPSPRVDSAILRISRYPEDILRTRERVVLLKEFSSIVQAGFVAPRKKLLRNLRSLGYARDLIERVFNRIGVALDARAETVSMEQWLRISTQLVNKKRG